MNKDIKDIIKHFTKSDTLLACLELAELLESEDYYNLTNSSIDILEKYIQSRTSIMDIHKRKLYMGKEYIHYTNQFKFSPGIRNRLMKAAKQISKSMYSSVYDSNKSESVCSKVMSSDSTKSMHFSNEIIKYNDTSINFSELTSNIIPNENSDKIENVERERHLNFLDKYYNDISKNACKNFENCFIKPKMDFEITIPEDDPTNLNGLYHCMLCSQRKQYPTIIKFKFSKYNSVIYTNINSHLKIHYKYLLDTAEMKRRKSIKAEPIINEIDQIIMDKEEMET